LIEDIVGIEIHTSYFMILNSKKIRNAPFLRIGSIEGGRPAQSIKIESGVDVAVTTVIRKTHKFF
jgi:hypothetical protein